MAIIEPYMLPRVRPLAQLTCAGGGEMVLETHSRRFAGVTLCQPCFTRREIGQIKEE